MSAPKAARELLDLAIDHGWGAAWRPGTDNNGNPHVEVRAARYVNHVPQEVRVVWHTRPHGTYRLFSAIASGGSRGWHDITLTQARNLIEGATS